jgi:hypothetical protein
MLCDYIANVRKNRPNAFAESWIDEDAVKKGLFATQPKSDERSSTFTVEALQPPVNWAICPKICKLSPHLYHEHAPNPETAPSSAGHRQFDSDGLLDPAIVCGRLL